MKLQAKRRDNPPQGLLSRLIGWLSLSSLLAALILMVALLAG